MDIRKFCKNQLHVELKASGASNAIGPDIRTDAIRLGGGVRPFDHRRRRRTGRLSSAAAAWLFVRRRRRCAAGMTITHNIFTFVYIFL